MSNFVSLMSYLICLFWIGEILQCRELWGRTFWGRHLKISGRLEKCRETEGGWDMCAVFSLLVFVGGRVEDQCEPGLSQPNAERHYWIGTAGRLSSLCLLCHGGEIPGTENYRLWCCLKSTIRNIYVNQLMNKLRWWFLVYKMSNPRLETMFCLVPT